MIEDFLYPYLRFYQNAPQFVRTAVGRAYRALPLSLRYGRTISYYQKLLGESPWWPEERKRAYVFEQIKTTLSNAYHHTAYYRRLMDRVGFRPESFRHMEQFEQLPIIDKSTLRTHKSEIINREIPRSKLLYMTTGGTSGIPVEVYYVKGRERSREYAFLTDIWKRVGFRFGDRIAMLRGIVVDHRGNNTLFKYEPIKNRLMLSSYDLREDTYPLYVERLRSFRPHFIHTYPSLATMLARYMKANAIRLPGLKAILCSSEQFYPGQREKIENSFHARVMSWYGHTEATTLAGECEESQDYHVHFEYGYTELIDEKGTVIREPGRQGELVGTSFEMTGFPIIRYRTGDFAEYAPGVCRCGRSYDRLTRVRGRWTQEHIVTKEGAYIPMTSLNMHGDIFDRVEQFQFHQREKGRVTLNIVKAAGYNETDEKKIQYAFEEKFKQWVDLRLAYVSSIERTKRGKHRFIVQELKED